MTNGNDKLGFEPVWPAPKSVRSFITYRGSNDKDKNAAAMSSANYGSFNLATHVGDSPENVAHNRKKLMDQLNLQTPPVWLNQIHGNVVVKANPKILADADGVVTSEKGVACAVLTADCLPILLCDREGTKVAALHGGWRGLATGIIEAGVKQFSTQPSELLAYLGPAIGPQNYEVGEEVVSALLSTLSAQASTATDDYNQIAQPNQHKPGHFYLNLYAVAQAQLKSLGITAIYGGDFCTYAQTSHFFSYRREGQCGRMASLIWIS